MTPRTEVPKDIYVPYPTLVLEDIRTGVRNESILLEKICYDPEVVELCLPKNLELRGGDERVG